MRVQGVALVLAGALATAVPASAEILPRAAPPAGTVVSRKTGEEARFIDISGWRTIEAKQDLLGGDVLRTNAYGHLAVLFSDRTQVRMGRNTTLVVKEIGVVADTRLGLTGGTIWARAERGGIGIAVDTPAASAAIRGTDWTMTVDGDGKTSLIVLEGVVELVNAQGSVTVAEGEGAVAAIGQAPTKIVIVDPKDREQMLFYLSLRNSFGTLAPTNLPGPAARGDIARIGSRSAASRSAEDWVALAEASLPIEGRVKAMEAVAAARRSRPTPSQAARLDLVEALVAGSEKRYADAVLLFERARPRLDRQRAGIAAYGAYFARSLADPDRIETPPARAGDGPSAALAAAYVAGFLHDLKSAAAVLQRAERLFPDDPSLPAFRAQVAILIDDREQAAAAIERALAIDPDEPTALEARSLLRAGYEGDIEGAYRDIERAARLAPGSTTIWNQLGNIQSARNAAREAEAAYLRAIELDPQDPASRANLAILYLDQARLAEAKRQIDLAMTADPAFDVALIALGRYYLQTGELERGVETLLAGATANPAYAQGLLLLGSAHYESGNREAAEQAIENADRLDPNDPVTSLFETSIAIDGYDSGRAIASAQESMRRARARGGDYAPASANRDAGSALNEAFRLQGLDGWGRYYGDLTFDPFAGASYVDQTVSGAASPFVNSVDILNIPVEPTIANSGFSTFFQGILLDPLSISGRSRSANLFRRPFFEGSFGGGFVREGDDWSWNGQAQLQAHAVTPVPWSMLVDLKGLETSAFRAYEPPGAPGQGVIGRFDNRNFSAFAFVAAQPTPHDRVVAFFDANRRKEDISDLFETTPQLFPTTIGTYLDRDLDTESAVAGLGWSHTIGYRNVVNAALFATRSRSDLFRNGGDLVDIGVLFGGAPVGLYAGVGERIDQTREADGYLASVNHLLGLGDLTLRYGVDGGYFDTTGLTRRIEYVAFPDGTLVELPPVTADTTAGFPIGRAYLDATYEIGPSLQVEAGAFVSWIGGPVDDVRLDPRIGLAWAPVDGHWLRAGYIRDNPIIDVASLAPVGVLGLTANVVPLGVDGYSDTFAARWDAEWSGRFFTSVDAQHQQLRSLSIADPYALATLDLDEASITRVSATANLALGHGFGLFATGAWTQSRNETLGPGFGAALPFAPELSGRAGVTFVHPSNVKATLAATYIGERTGDLAGTILDEYVSVDAFLEWEPFDKRVALELAAYNLLDTAFLVAPRTPGWGRTFTGSLKLRF